MRDDGMNDGTLNDQERFEAWLKEAAKEHYNAPPEPPRDHMWDAIEAARSSGSGESSESGTHKPSPVLSLANFRRYPTWLKIAAALVIGLGLGRLTLVQSGNTNSGEQLAVVAQEDSDLSRTEGSSTLPYRIAAREHLDQTEALLTGFRTSVRDSATRVEMGPWARGLLARTRLLMDSPAAEDAELALLLSDLEFVLAQIVQLRGDDDDEEFGYIDDGLEERQVLLRIQTVAAQSPTRL
ncbi:MAG: hypothetical protein ABFS14_12705 [Gemmatimonadota bacterium]